MFEVRFLLNNQSFREYSVCFILPYLTLGSIMYILLYHANLCSVWEKLVIF